MIKTIVTIGPNSAYDQDIIKFSKYTNHFRLNGSHSDITWHKNAIHLIRNHCPNAFILMDIPGIKPRTANQTEINIKKDQQVCFGSFIGRNEFLQIPLTKPLPTPHTKIKYFSVNDGQYSFNISSMGDQYVVGTSSTDFTLLPKKGINLPGSIYDEEHQFEIYKEYIASINELNIDAIGLSFVQTGDLVENIRQIRPDLVLVSKIENTMGLVNCESIVSSSDAIMIDRGDLVAEIGYQNLFSGIENIAKATKRYGKPLIIATENLESMISRQLPSKSETVALSHSINIGADSFMLSEETAVSDNRHIITKWLFDFLNGAMRLDDPPNFIPEPEIEELNSIWNSIKNFKHLPMVIMSKSGRALPKLLARVPNAKIFLITNKQKVRKFATLYKNEPIVLSITEDSEIATIDNIWRIVCENKSEIFENHDAAIAIYVSKYVKDISVNTISVLSKFHF